MWSSSCFCFWSSSYMWYMVDMCNKCCYRYLPCCWTAVDYFLLILSVFHKMWWLRFCLVEYANTQRICFTIVYICIQVYGVLLYLTLLHRTYRLLHNMVFHLNGASARKKSFNKFLSSLFCCVIVSGKKSFQLGKIIQYYRCCCCHIAIQTR